MEWWILPDFSENNLWDRVSDQNYEHSATMFSLSFLTHLNKSQSTMARFKSKVPAGRISALHHTFCPSFRHKANDRTLEHLKHSGATFVLDHRLLVCWRARLLGSHENTRYGTFRVQTYSPPLGMCGYEVGFGFTGLSWSSLMNVKDAANPCRCFLSSTIKSM